MAMRAEHAAIEIDGWGRLLGEKLSLKRLSTAHNAIFNPKKYSHFPQGILRTAQNPPSWPDWQCDRAPPLLASEAFSYGL
jgi:hypothetical protein